MPATFPPLLPTRSSTAAFIRSEIPHVRAIVDNECWLEGERRGHTVDHRDPAIRDRVADILLDGAGDDLRRQCTKAMGLPNPAPPPRASVLLVDDESGVRTIFEEFLTEAGYVVQCANNGREGWVLFNDSVRNGSTYDLVITDRAMPEVGGEVLGQLIKSASPRTPLIMITGQVDAIARPEVFTEILAKPFLPSALLASISRVLAKAAAADAPRQA